MNGCIIANTPIAVDFWRVSSESPRYIHFLSHMHSDHINGLSSSWRRPVYCSEITSRLLKAKLQVKESLIHALPLGQPVIIPLAHDNKETMTVTLIDANHCPGAVMFLFEGYFGEILYTGDFKYSPAMFSEGKLQDFSNIDVLYLDNTFNNEGCVWPPEEEAAEMIEGIIASSISDTNFFFALHNLGKEELLVRIAKKFQRWIVVSPARYETLKLLEMPNVFTTDPEASNICVISQSEVTWKNLIKWNSAGAKTTVIVPSALYKLSKAKKAYSHPNVCLIPYSSHSSYTELVTFVSKVCPKKIIPIVKEEGSCSDVSNFDCFLSKCEPLQFEIPECVKLFQRTGSYGRRELTRVNQQVRARPMKRKVPSGIVYEDLAEVESECYAKTFDVAVEGQVLPSEDKGEGSLNSHVNGSPDPSRKRNESTEPVVMAACEEVCSHELSQGAGNCSTTLSCEQKRLLGKKDAIRCKKQKEVCRKTLDSRPLNGISFLQCRGSKLKYKMPKVKIVSIPIKNRMSFYQVFQRAMAKMTAEKKVK